MPLAVMYDIPAGFAKDSPILRRSNALSKDTLPPPRVGDSWSGEPPRLACSLLVDEQ